MEPIGPMIGMMALTALIPSFDPMNYDRETLVRSMVQAGIVASRAAVDVTYDSAHFDKQSNTVTLLGLDVRPPREADLPDGCAFHLARASVRLDLTFDAATLRVETRDGHVASACLGQRERAGMPPPLAALGDDLMRLTHSVADIRYGFADSTLDLTLEAEGPAVGRLDAVVQLDHMHVQRVRWEELPAGNFLGAQATYAPSETAAALIPMALQAATGGAPVESLVDMVMAELPGSTTAGNKDEAMLVASAKAQLQQTVANGAPITLVLAPRRPFPLMDAYAMDGPRDLIPALRPRFMAAPPAADMVDILLLAQALEDNPALSDTDRLTVGRALATGVGAPQSAEAAAEVLAPLVAQRHAEAATLAAQVLKTRAPHQAYQAALIGAMGGDGAAISLATDLEGRLTLEEIRDAQESVVDVYGGARLEAVLDQAAQTATPAEIRRIALALAEGRAYPRVYEGAYGLALVAAAAGDRSAALLIDELTARFSADPAWSDLVEGAERGALQAWTQMGIGRRLAE